MRSIILVGGEKEREDFLDNHITQNKIKPYNVTRFRERVTIAVVRNIKRSLKFKEQEKRLVVLPRDITIEAQNALLRTLEELPENLDVIFTAEFPWNFLPTVISRSRVLSVGGKEEEKTRYKKFIYDLINSEKKENTVFYALKLAQNLESGKDDLRQLILDARSTLLEEIESASVGIRVFRLYKLIESFTKIYPYIPNNNLNIRLTVENTIFESLL